MFSPVLILLTTMDLKQTKFQWELPVAVCSFDNKEVEVLTGEVF